MNQFTVAVLVLVVFCYFGGKYCPAVLKQNKQILLGVVGGLVLASFFGFRLEALGGDGVVTSGNRGGSGAGGSATCCDYKKQFEIYGMSWESHHPAVCDVDITCPEGR